MNLFYPFFRGEQNQYVEAILFYLAITACNNFLILSIFPKYVSDKKRAGRAFWQGHVLACTILFLVTLLCISVLGPELMTTAYYPLFALTQRVSFGNFAERIEALLTILWFITIYFKICLYLYVSAKGIGNMFQLKNIKHLCCRSPFFSSSYRCKHLKMRLLIMSFTLAQRCGFLSELVASYRLFLFL